MTGISPTDSVMAIRNAILQKNAALRDVAQTGNVGTGAAVGTNGATAPGGFTDALKSALNQVNGLQNQAGEAAASFERGNHRYRRGHAGQAAGVGQLRSHPSGPQQIAVRLQGHHEHAGVI